MVKLQKHKAYTYRANDGKKIDHFKYLVTIPESAMDELGWSEGEELNVIIEQHAMVLKADADKREKGKKQ